MGLARAEEGGVGERAVPERGQAERAPGWQMLAGCLAAPQGGVSASSESPGKSSEASEQPAGCAR